MTIAVCFVHFFHAIVVVVVALEDKHLNIIIHTSWCDGKRKGKQTFATRRKQKKRNEEEYLSIS